eukprot:1330766-Amphidinium_carterae.1
MATSQTASCCLPRATLDQSTATESWHQTATFVGSGTCSPKGLSEEHTGGRWNSVDWRRIQSWTEKVAVKYFPISSKSTPQDQIRTLDQKSFKKRSLL